MAARAMRSTGRPVGLLVWRGRHAWVMSGFQATKDPMLPGAKVTRAIVEDPLYPYGGSTLGPQPATRRGAVGLRSSGAVRAAPSVVTESVTLEQVRHRHAVRVPSRTSCASMGFLRRLLGGDRGGTRRRRGAAHRPSRDRTADTEERARDLELLREDQERLDDLTRRQLRYAEYAWEPPAQGGERRADDEDRGGERLDQATRPVDELEQLVGGRARSPCGAIRPRGSGRR